MKTIILMAFLGLFSSASLAQDVDLMGTWENEQMSIVYKFSDDSMYFQQQTFGSWFDYKMDTSQEPYSLEITLSYAGQVQIIPALLKVVDQDHIWIEQFPPGIEPTGFTEGELGEKTIHKLTRRKED